MKRIRVPTRLSLRRVVIIAALVTAFPVLSGCTNAQAGALWGATFGALLGHDTESRLVGSAVGAGIGYVIGNEADRAATERQRYYGGYGR